MEYTYLIQRFMLEHIFLYKQAFLIDISARITRRNVFIQTILVVHILFDKSDFTANSMVVPFPFDLGCLTAKRKKPLQCKF